MKFEDHLSKEQRQQLNKMRTKPSKRKTKRKQEHLSRREWEDIMGVYRATYERRNGAVRRK
jgi:hypothetical protein